MFGDNRSVVHSSTLQHARLHKRYNALSFHRVREAIASIVVQFHHIPGVINPADILSKHWGYTQIWDILKPILFWEGDTADLMKKKWTLYGTNSQYATTYCSIKQWNGDPCQGMGIVSILAARYLRARKWGVTEFWVFLRLFQLCFLFGNRPSLKGLVCFYLASNGLRTGT